MKLAFFFFQSAVLFSLKRFIFFFVFFFNLLEERYIKKVEEDQLTRKSYSLVDIWDGRNRKKR